MDTEFERSRTYRINPCLLQVCHGETVFLVDLLPEAMQAGLDGRLSPVIMHSGSEDMQLLQQMHGETPAEVFDTQVAAAMCGYGLHLSYQNLVREVTGVELPKGLSRSDWARRPLSAQQVDYAIEDVIYLQTLRDELSERMESRGLMPLFDLVMRQWCERVLVDSSDDKLFNRLTYKSRLSLPLKQRLWALLDWRKQQAVRRNKPKNWIMDPQQLLAIVQGVDRVEDLQKLGLNGKFIQYNGEHIVQLLHASEQMDPAKLPQDVHLSKAQSRQMDRLKSALKSRCESLGVADAMLLNKDQLKRMVVNDESLESQPFWALLPAV